MSRPSTASKWGPKPVDDLSLAFPTNVSELLPPWKDIPEEFKRFGGTRWNQVVNDWFFCGLTNAQWTTKPGVARRAALRHIKACMGSWEPTHEHKEAGCAFLMSEFFENVVYIKGSP